MDTYIHSSSQLITSCITKMMIIGYEATSLHKFLYFRAVVFAAGKHVYSSLIGTQVRHHARFREDCSSLNGKGCTERSGEHYACGCSWAKWIGGHGVDEKGPIWQDHHRDPKSQERQVCRWKSSPASFAPLQLPYTIMVYGLTPYIHEYFTCEYFNTTVPSNR